jgi:hypothetical protein
MLESFDLQAELSACAQPDTYDVPYEDEFANKGTNDLLEGRQFLPTVTMY